MGMQIGLKSYVQSWHGRNIVSAQTLDRLILIDSEIT